MSDKLPIYWQCISQKSLKSSSSVLPRTILGIYNNDLGFMNPLKPVYRHTSEPCYSKHNPRTSNIRITWEPVRHAEPQTPTQYCWVRICLLIRHPNDARLWAHEQLLQNFWSPRRFQCLSHKLREVTILSSRRPQSNIYEQMQIEC